MLVYNDTRREKNDPNNELNSTEEDEMRLLLLNIPKIIGVLNFLKSIWTFLNKEVQKFIQTVVLIYATWDIKFCLIFIVSVYIFSTPGNHFVFTE